MDNCRLRRPSCAAALSAASDHLYLRMRQTGDGSPVVRMRSFLHWEVGQSLMPQRRQYI